MAISTAFSPTAATIYRRRNSRNLFKKLPTIPFCYHRTASYSFLKTTPNPRKESIFSGINRLLSFHTRISDTHSGYSSCGKTLAGIATEPLKAEATMTVAAALCIEDGCLLVNGKVVLEGIPKNVVVSPVNDGLSSSSAAFIGASSSIPSSRHVFSLGVLRYVPYLCLRLVVKTGKK